MFGHLHVHTEHSYLDGFGTAEDYALAAKNKNFTFLACTDHGNIDGLIKFQNACKKYGIKPILGCEAYIVPDLSVKEKGEKRGHITLFVKNEIGFVCKFRNITKMHPHGLIHIFRDFCAFRGYRF